MAVLIGEAEHGRALLGAVGVYATGIAGVDAGEAVAIAGVEEGQAGPAIAAMGVELTRRAHTGVEHIAVRPRQHADLGLAAVDVRLTAIAHALIGGGRGHPAAVRALGVKAEGLAEAATALIVAATPLDEALRIAGVHQDLRAILIVITQPRALAVLAGPAAHAVIMGQPLAAAQIAVIAAIGLLGGHTDRGGGAGAIEGARRADVPRALEVRAAGAQLIETGVVAAILAARRGEVLMERITAPSAGAADRRGMIKALRGGLTRQRTLAGHALTGGLAGVADAGGADVGGGALGVIGAGAQVELAGVVAAILTARVGVAAVLWIATPDTDAADRRGVIGAVLVDLTDQGGLDADALDAGLTPWAGRVIDAGLGGGGAVIDAAIRGAEVRRLCPLWIAAPVTDAADRRGAIGAVGGACAERCGRAAALQADLARRAVLSGGAGGDDPAVIGAAALAAIIGGLEALGITGPLTEAAQRGVLIGAVLGHAADPRLDADGHADAEITVGAVAEIAALAGAAVSVIAAALGAGRAAPLALAGGIITRQTARVGAAVGVYIAEGIEREIAGIDAAVHVAEVRLDHRLRRAGPSALTPDRGLAPRAVGVLKAEGRQRHAAVDVIAILIIGDADLIGGAVGVIATLWPGIIAAIRAEIGRGEVRLARAAGIAEPHAGAAQGGGSASARLIRRAGGLLDGATLAGRRAVGVGAAGEAVGARGAVLIALATGRRGRRRFAEEDAATWTTVIAGDQLIGIAAPISETVNRRSQRLTVLSVMAHHHLDDPLIGRLRGEALIHGGDLGVLSDERLIFAGLHAHLDLTRQEAERQERQQVIRFEHMPLAL